MLHGDIIVVRPGRASRVSCADTACLGVLLAECRRPAAGVQRAEPRAPGVRRPLGLAWRGRGVTVCDSLLVRGPPRPATGPPAAGSRRLIEHSP